MTGSTTLRFRRPGAALGALAVGLSLLVGPVALLAAIAAPASAYTEPPEDYAPYQPETRCRDRAQPGTRALAAWITDRFRGGAAVASIRACSASTSEHQDGRAIDWAMDARKRAHRREVRRFLDGLFRADKDGHEHATARRMGVMYVIWNDHIYRSYQDRFAKRDYLSSSCRSVRSCSRTLRHRDHVHLSLSKPGGRGDTSWYHRHDPVEEEPAP